MYKCVRDRQWWIRQTSCGIFRILLVLYGLQLINMAIYFTRPSFAVTGDLSPISADCNTTSGVENQVSSSSEIADVSAEEVLVPALMMCLLSLLLSQMVSTHLNGKRSLRKPKNRIRMKRTKRRIGRRISTTASGDSKSSVENLVENLESLVDLKRDDAVVKETQVKKRSLSEERPPTRMKSSQRSASLHISDADPVEQRLPPVVTADQQHQTPVHIFTFFFTAMAILKDISIIFCELEMMQRIADSKKKRALK